MEKSWLIRTRSFQILGPISKEKVQELIDKGSMSVDDEICSGNGYWFSVKEKDLVKKYLDNGLTQTFNPISEAVDVVTAKNANTDVQEVKPQTQIINLDDFKQSNEDEPISIEDSIEEAEEVELPDEDDLEYPDPSNLSIDEVESESKESSDEESAGLKIHPINNEGSGKNTTIIAKLERKSEEEKAIPPEISRDDILKDFKTNRDVTRTDLNIKGIEKKPEKTGNPKDENYLKFLLIFLIILITAIVLKYLGIIKISSNQLNIIPSAIAQNVSESFSKKKD